MPEVTIDFFPHPFLHLVMPIVEFYCIWWWVFFLFLCHAPHPHRHSCAHIHTDWCCRCIWDWTLERAIFFHCFHVCLWRARSIHKCRIQIIHTTPSPNTGHTQILLCVCFFFSNVHNCNLFFQCRTQPRAFIIHGCHASLFFSLELLVPSLCLMPLTSSRHTASGFVPLSLSSPEHFLGWFTVAWKGCVCAAVLLSVFYTTRLLMSVSEACCI